MTSDPSPSAHGHYPPTSYPVGMPVYAHAPPVKRFDREKSTAALLALFLGGLGIHKFYLGQTGLGIVYLLFCWTLIPAFVAFIEFIVLASKDKAQFDREYNY